MNYNRLMLFMFLTVIVLSCNHSSFYKLDKHKLTNFSHGAIDSLVNNINTLKEGGGLESYYLPEISDCGEWVFGFYKKNKLQLIETEKTTGFGLIHSRFYWNNDNLIKVSSVYIKSNTIDMSNFDELIGQDELIADLTEEKQYDTIYKSTSSTIVEFIAMKNISSEINKIDSMSVLKLVSCGLNLKKELEKKKIRN